MTSPENDLYLVSGLSTRVRVVFREHTRKPIKTSSSLNLTKLQSKSLIDLLNIRLFSPRFKLLIVWKKPGGLPYKKDRGALIEKFEKKRKKYQYPVLWAWFEIFSPLKDINFKTKHLLLFSVQYPKRHHKSSRCSPFEAKLPKRKIATPSFLNGGFFPPPPPMTVCFYINIDLIVVTNVKHKKI